MLRKVRLLGYLNVIVNHCSTHIKQNCSMGGGSRESECVIKRTHSSGNKYVQINSGVRKCTL